MKTCWRVLSWILTIVILLCVMSAFLLTLTAFLGELDWRLDLTSHFRPLYLMVEVIALVLFALLQKKKLLLITLLFLSLNAIPLLPLYVKTTRSHDSLLEFKLMQFNVCAPAKDYGVLSHYLFQEKPDLVVLEECADRCVNNLKRDKVLDQYPYFFRKIPNRHRLVVLSKFPIRPVSTPKLFADPAVAQLSLDLHDRPIHLFIMHSTRPSSGALYYRNQIQQFKQIGQLAAQSKLPFLLVGDLNVSPWNNSFSLLLRESHLKNSMDGFGFQPSFPTFVPHLGRFRVFPIIPIDHVLFSKHFTVLNRHSGPRLQSDHLPIVVEIGLNQAS